MRLSRTFAVVLCAFATLAGAATASAADDPYSALLAPAGTCGAAAEALELSLPTAQQAMLCLTNYARTRSGLVPLRLDAALNQAGQAKLVADVSCREFTHTPCGKPFDSVFAPYLDGARSYSIGENIAWGTGSYGTPRQTMSSWLHSAHHRENILTAEFRDLGIGYVPNQTFLGNRGAALWAQSFGSRTPASAKAAPVNPPAAATPANASAKPVKPTTRKQAEHRKLAAHKRQASGPAARHRHTRHAASYRAPR
jgi:uncharacterized protein YkwD